MTNVRYLRICDNCMDFDREKNTCKIRFTILPDKTKIPMSRKSMQPACKVFLFK